MNSWGIEFVLIVTYHILLRFSTFLWFSRIVYLPQQTGPFPIIRTGFSPFKIATRYSTLNKYFEYIHQSFGKSLFYLCPRCFVEQIPIIVEKFVGGLDAMFGFHLQSDKTDSVDNCLNLGDIGKKFFHFIDEEDGDVFESDRKAETKRKREMVNQE